MARWGARTSAVPGQMGLSKQSFDELEQLISALKTGSKEFSFAMNVAAQMMAKASQGHVQRLYRGPQTNPGDVSRGLGAGSAWTIPVRRITGKTYRGWKVRMIAFGAWEVYSEERGAWMVEHGIVRGGGGTPRPVLRMAGIETLRMIQRSKFGNRIMAGTFGELKNNKGHFVSFSERIAASEVFGGGTG